MAGANSAATQPNRMELMQQAEVQDVIQRKYAGLFAALESAWSDAFSLMAVGARLGAGISEDRRLCLIAVYTKMIRLAYSAGQLCKLGLGLEAQLQARTMFENYLQLKFLDHAENIDACASQYIYWDMANDEGVHEKILELHPELKPKIDEIRKPLLDFKASLSKSKWGDFVFYGPSRLSVFKLCEHIDKLEKSNVQVRTYKTLYHETSGQAHGFDFLDYARRRGPNDVEALLAPAEERVEDVLVTVLITLSNTCKIVDNRLNLDKKGVIDKMDKTVQGAVLALPLMAGVTVSP